MEQTNRYGHQPMTLCRFRRLSPRAQLVFVLTEGIYLAHRWEDGQSRVNLYHLSGEGSNYFAEVSLDESEDCFIVLRSFDSNAPLEDYIHYIQLPDL